MENLKFLANEILSRKELRNVIGGGGGSVITASVCKGKSESDCKDACTSDDGITGTCAWVEANVNACKCATVSEEE